MSMGKRIKERRLQLGMSADDLAEKLGKNRATIYRYEGDEIENFPISVVQPLADLLMTTPAYLMGWENDPDVIAQEPGLIGDDSTDEAPAENISNDSQREMVLHYLTALSTENQMKWLEYAQLLLLSQKSDPDSQE